MARRLQTEQGIATMDWETRAHRIVELIRTSAGVQRVAAELDAMEEGDLHDGFMAELDVMAISRQAGDDASARGFEELHELRHRQPEPSRSVA
jgi:hypothetical protein